MTRLVNMMLVLASIQVLVYLRVSLGRSPAEMVKRSDTTHPLIIGVCCWSPAYTCTIMNTGLTTPQGRLD
jgi:hypothetical protein